MEYDVTMCSDSFHAAATVGLKYCTNEWVFGIYVGLTICDCVVTSIHCVCVFVYMPHACFLGVRQSHVL